MRLGLYLCYVTLSFPSCMLNRILLLFCSFALEMAKLPPGSWEGSDVRKDDIEWLIRSRRVAPEVGCRLPGKEHIPTPQPGERVVFLTHFAATPSHAHKLRCLSTYLFVFLVNFL